MKEPTKPYLIFAVAAVAAWFGGWLFSTSGDAETRHFGLFLLIVCGLGAITLPIVWSLQRPGGKSPEGHSTAENKEGIKLPTQPRWPS